MKTNNLKYTTFRTAKDGTQFQIKIRLNDECKNGHQDFSITGDMWEAGKPRTDRNNIGGGAIGDKIAKEFPEFQIFEDLHLCDYLGNPMHGIANGFYHLKNGFNRTPSTDPKFKEEFCKYYRVTSEQFDELIKAHSQTHYGILLTQLDVPKQWKKQADEAIKQLEKLTGDEFVVDSSRTQLDIPNQEVIESEKEKIANGYYSNEAIQQREKQAGEKLIEDLEAEFDEKVAAARLELDVKKELFRIGGKRFLNNPIFYNHTKSLQFNWRGYGEKIEKEEIEKVMKKFKLPSRYKGLQIPFEVEKKN